MNTPAEPSSDPVQPPQEAGGSSSDPIRVCPYCRESVHARAEKCRYCHSYLSEIGRQRALYEWLASVGLPNVEVGRLGCLGLSLPGAALFAVAAYFGAQGLFSIFARQPAVLQAALGIVGVLLAFTFFRARQ